MPSSFSQASSSPRDVSGSRAGPANSSAAHGGIRGGEAPLPPGTFVLRSLPVGATTHGMLVVVISREVGCSRTNGSV